MPGFRGAIFDVDGVLVDSPHEAAWRDAFQELMQGEWADIADQTSWNPDAFTSQVYQQELSGKPRMEGAIAALRHFGVPEPETRVDAYAERKQEMVVELIEAGKFSAYPDALRFLLAVKDAGIGVAAASSSKNAGLFLRQIRLDEFAEQDGLQYGWIEPGLTLLAAFDADISGRHFERGKPHPEIFLTAAQELGVEPQAAFVVEDAVSGVQAAKAGEFAALGVARHDDEALLSAADADIVVTTLDAIDLARLTEGRLVSA
ncbi:MAG: Beta-phosphoglucomutase [uncultured Solirubrobacteraceae bacterium]|uniref:Beta-phosphoglucomutase n=1 Tax=uncultured Solirubrobacteraceae bacterium TaxID=1162706 RepID=A0A6J4RKK0_9ACTN|nr:MAG: Beta-phosphoglucomutase [uncultured Solirubrobacteraceae bacterium]